MGALYWVFTVMIFDPYRPGLPSSPPTTKKSSTMPPKDIFSPIVNAYYSSFCDTSDLQIWVTSDLFAAVFGIVSYSWVNYAGAAITVSNLSAANTSVSVGVVNATHITALHYTDLNSTLAGSKADAGDARLQLSVSAKAGGTVRCFTPQRVQAMPLTSRPLIAPREARTRSRSTCQRQLQRGCGWT